VTKPIGITRHRRETILLFLETVGRPARTSEIRTAVHRWFPEASVYSCLGELVNEGRVKRITRERDALVAMSGEGK
jgi:hypothetical protein